jgi:hypothetical protein
MGLNSEIKMKIDQFMLEKEEKNKVDQLGLLFRIKKKTKVDQL